MSPHEAEELADHAKGLFRFMTAYQGKVFIDRLLRFPNRLYVQQILEHFAVRKPEDVQEGNLPLTAIVERMDTELRRLGLTTADEERLKRLQEESRTAEFWDEADAWARSLSPEEIERHTALAVGTFPPESREFFKSKTIATSKTLLGVAFEAHNQSEAGATR